MNFYERGFTILLRYSSYICSEIENLTLVAISYDFMKRTFGEFHKFNMKWPRLLDSVYYMTH